MPVCANKKMIAGYADSFHPDADHNASEFKYRFY